MKPPLIFFLAAISAGIAHGQTATTTPVGFISTTCLPNSDTIIGIPLRQSSIPAELTAAPAVDGDQAVLTSIGGLDHKNRFVPTKFGDVANTHYVKFRTSDTAAGQWFPITANTETSLTVDLNGASFTAARGDCIEVVKFWTLDELFDPRVATTNAVTTGNAIVASPGTSLADRRTQILMPNLHGVGINNPPNAAFYVHNGMWKQEGKAGENKGLFQLWPDGYLIIRHPSAVPKATVFTNTGEVDPADFRFNLVTRVSGYQDNYLALPRPVAVSLDALNLGGTSAFVTSTSTSLSGRRDQLLVFGNSPAGHNQTPSRTYFHFGGKWQLQGDAS
ncbi:MAG: TIGR02597 family protein [Verrucomicrobiota bacterium]